MFTPAMTASSTSSPRVIIEKAFCTQVRLPPFLNLFPLADEMTRGLTAAGISIVGTLLLAAREDATAIPAAALDRKSTRLNSSHGYISYAVFCLKKKNDN